MATKKNLAIKQYGLPNIYILERYVKKFFRQSFLTETKHPSAQQMRLRISISASAADWQTKHSTKVSPVLTSVNVTSN